MNRELSAPELPAKRRLALIVATSGYADSSLRQLRAPAQDASDLSDVLADPRIGGFDVVQMIDRSAQEIRLAIEEIVSDRLPDDLLLIYLSCHGLIDARRRLYFAATDTLKRRLAATGVESEWVLEQMDDCRARRQVIILDCCFSGAFARGAKGSTDVDLGERFHGRGRVVLTASRSTEYSFEGEPLDGSVSPPGSVFTSALVTGIRTGDADRDNDGIITVDEAYAYVFDSIRTAHANQTPQRWLYGGEGQIPLAYNVAGRKVAPSDLPEAIRVALESRYPHIRIGAINTLGEWFTGDDHTQATIARDLLRRVVDQDIPQVAKAAREIIQPASIVEPSTAPRNSESDIAEQDNLVEQLGLAVASNAPSAWDHLTVSYRAVGKYAEATGTVTLGDYGPYRWLVTKDILSMFAKLREIMYRKNHGTWISANYTLNFPSTFNLEYDMDEPRWLKPPPQHAYIAELMMYPRTVDNIPEWLSRAVRVTPDREARSSADTKTVPEEKPAAHRWPIQPLAGEPPLTLFRGKRMIELPAGTEVDRFGNGDGNLTYAAGTPFSQRSLVPEWVKRPYRAYQLAQPIQVLTGAAIPWFEQAGGGTAYYLPATIDKLLADGHLIVVHGRATPLD